MIKKHLLKTILTATVVATVLMTTACGSKQTSDNNTTVQQTPEAVKVVSNVDVKTEAEKPNEETDKLKEEAEKQPEQTEEEKEEQIEQPEENAEAVNTEAEVNAEEVNEAQNTVSEEVQEEQAEPEATPAEQPAEAPAENNNAGAVDTTPEEQPAAPAEPSPAPSTAPAPVVTPQEPAKPSVTEEQQLVATGKWIKYTDDYLDEGKVYTYYEYKDPITGYSMVACFCDGAFHHEQYGDENAEKAIFTAHGINDNITSFERLMKLSNS